MQLFEAIFVRSLLIVKSLEHGKFKEWYHVKEERLLYRSLHSENYVTFTLTTWNRVVYFYDKHPTTFRMLLLFQGLPLNNYGVECKENSTM